MVIRNSVIGTFIKDDIEQMRNFSSHILSFCMTVCRKASVTEMFKFLQIFQQTTKLLWIDLFLIGWNFRRTGFPGRQLYESMISLKLKVLGINIILHFHIPILLTPSNRLYLTRLGFLWPYLKNMTSIVNCNESARTVN